jgi:predicted MPP superfamily phosphohydrolase
VRALIFLAIALAIFLPFNWITIRQLLRFHPQRRRWVIGAAIAGNLMWPFFLALRSPTGFGRVSRAVLGPPWFAWTSFAIVYTALVLVLLLAWLPFRRRRTFAEFGRWPSRVFLALAAIGAVIGFYDATVPLRVVPVRVPIANLPQDADGMKVVLMGDLHVGLFTRPSRLEKIFSAASNARPDAVLIAGDMIDDDPHFGPKLLAGAAHLDPKIPLFGVLGNHEIYGDPHRVIEQMRGSRIRLLVNEGAGVGPLWIAGVSDPASIREKKDVTLQPDLTKALAAKPAASVPIVLAHQPKIFEEARKRGLPLTLCAHTHGGQLGIRPLGWSLAGVFLEYHMGLYHLHGSRLYINTGTGFWLVPFRLGMSPEITVVELVRE